jgi:hypothetical protein
VETFINFKAIAPVRKLRNTPFYPLLCQNCVKTHVARALLCHGAEDVAIERH